MIWPFISCENIDRVLGNLNVERFKEDRNDVYFRKGDEVIVGYTIFVPEPGEASFSENWRWVHMMQYRRGYLGSDLYNSPGYFNLKYFKKNGFFTININLRHRSDREKLLFGMWKVLGEKK